MKTVAYILLPVSFLLMTGCVTEGVPTNEPASPEEAARANIDLGIGYLEQNRPELAIDCSATSASAMADAASARVASERSFLMVPTTSCKA